MKNSSCACGRKANRVSVARSSSRPPRSSARQIRVPVTVATVAPHLRTRPGGPAAASAPAVDLLMGTAKLATDWLTSLDERPVGGWATVDELRARPGGPLPHDSADPRLVVEDLARAAEPGLVAIPSGRYFGFVIGGGLPAAVAADWLTTVWDQCPGLYPCGPAAAVAEEVVEEWVRDLLGLPRGTSSALVPGCQTAHLTGLAAARHHVLRAVGWDVEEQGMTGAPPIRAVLGASRHVSVDRALRLPGIGTAAHRIVPADSAGRLDVSRLRA